MQELAPPSASAWEGLGQYLSGDTSRLLDTDARREFLSQWKDIARQESELNDAILIGLVGGTGVGKSTFINALAGNEISRSSDRRPTTSRVVVYRHVDTELPAEIPQPHLSRPQVLHQHAELSKVILLDFPDFDSAETSHRDIVAEYLPHLDVLLVVVDDMKYGDRRLYDLLSSLEHDQSNLFVLLNKIDRLRQRYASDTERVIHELRADLRRKFVDHAGIHLNDGRIFPISAYSVYVERTERAPAVDAAGFGDVEAMLHRFQVDKHRRAAKEKNLDVRKADLVADVKQRALSPENRDVIADSQTLVSKWRTEVAQAIAAIPVEILGEREHRGLQEKRNRRAGQAWGQPIALLLTLLAEFGRWRRGAHEADTSDLANRILVHYRSFFDLLANLRARVKSEIAGSSLATELAYPVREWTRALDSPDTLCARLGQEFTRRLNEGGRIRPPLAGWLTHLPAISVLALAVWSRAYPLLDSVAGTGDQSFSSALFRAIIGSLSPSFLIGVVCALVVAYFLTTLFIWIREKNQLQVEIADEERRIAQQVQEYGQRVVNSVDDRVQSLHQEFEHLGALIG